VRFGKSIVHQSQLETCKALLLAVRLAVKVKVSR